MTTAEVFRTSIDTDDDPTTPEAVWRWQELAQPEPAWYQASQRALAIFENPAYRAEITRQLDNVQLLRLPTELPAPGQPEAPARLRSVCQMEPWERAQWVCPGVRETHTDGQARSLPIRFDDLQADIQSMVVAYAVYEVYSRSADPTNRQAASQRNWARVQSGQPVADGSRVVHTTTTEALPSILAAGILCGEALPARSGPTNQYPLTVSTYRVDQPSWPGQPLRLPETGAYGLISLICQEEGTSDLTSQQLWQSTADPQRQYFGGIPATAISAVVINDDNRWFVDNPNGVARRAIADIEASGLYLPVYRRSDGSQLWG